MGIVSSLAWLGRRGGVLIAIAVFAGLLVPPLAALLKPFLLPAILGPFVIALLRIDWQRLAHQLGRPLEIGAALLWLLLVSPVLVHLLLTPFGLPPLVHGGLVMMAAAPPLMASGYLALLIGLDAARAVALTLVSTALMPFTLPLVSLYLLGVDIDVPLGDLMLRLALVVGGCLAFAWLLRRLIARAFIARHAEPLDGLAVLGLLIFAIAIMDGVSALLLRQPGFALLCVLAVIGVNLTLQLTGSLAFAWLGRRGALTIGMCGGSGNFGLLLAALTDRVSFELLLLIAAAQLPIYILPVIQKHLYRSWLRVAPLPAPATPLRSKDVRG
jgi:BASS family bile acid:Na+ symporter